MNSEDEQKKQKRPRRQCRNQQQSFKEADSSPKLRKKQKLLVKVESEKKSPSITDVALLKGQRLKIGKELRELNEKTFANRRGLFSDVDALTLQRLGNTSYVYYDDKRTYSGQFENILNRNYKSVPYDSGREPSLEQTQKYWNDFHNSLKNLEDRKYKLDSELLYLRTMIKKQQKNENLNFDIEKSESRIRCAIEERKYLIRQLTNNENMCYYLSIDQRFYLKNCGFSIDQLKAQAQLENPFYFYSCRNQSPYLLDLQNTFENQKLKIPFLQSPQKFYSFTNKDALFITSNIILQALKEVGKGASSITWMQNLFIDLIKSLFDVTISDNQLPFINHLCASMVLLSMSQIPESNRSPEIEEQTVQMGLDFGSETKIKFYPNFKSEEQVFYGSPKLEDAMMIFFEIYQRILKLTLFSEKIKFKEIEFVLSDLLFSACYTFLRKFMSLEEWQTILKQIFDEEVAIYILPLVSLILEFKKLFYELYSKEYQKLFQKWIFITLGDESITIKNENIPKVKTTTTQILKQMRQKVVRKSESELGRIQIINKLMIIHVFKLKDLY